MNIGQDEHRFYLKETMRLMAKGFEIGRKIHYLEQEFREAEDLERAEQFRAVKMAVYDFTFDCRIRNGELINSAKLRHREWKLLRMRHLRGYSWERLYNTQGYSPEHCKRIHRDGMTKIAEQNRNTNFREIHDREKARLNEILAQIDEKA